MLRVLTKREEHEDISSTFEWSTCSKTAVLQLGSLSIRHLKSACKGPKRSAKTPKGANKRGSVNQSVDGDDGRVYIVLEGNLAFDLLWLSSVLPKYILDVLIAETLPPAAVGTTGIEGRCATPAQWFEHIAKSLRLLFCLVQLGQEYPVLTSNLLYQHDPAAAVRQGTGDARRAAPPSPALLVDVLLFSHTIALAMRHPADDGAEEGPSAESAPAAPPDAPDEEGTGRDGNDAGGSAGELDLAVGSSSHPIDVVGMVLKTFAVLLRTEHGDEARPFRDALVNHVKVTRALCEGIFDAMDECFSQMTNDCIPDRRRRELKTYVEAVYAHSMRASARAHTHEQIRTCPLSCTQTEA